MVIPFTNVLRNIFQGFLRFLGINEEGLAAGGMGMIAGLAAMGKVTLRPGAGISGNSTYSPTPAGTSNGPFGLINAPESSQTSRITPGIANGSFGVINGPMPQQAQGSLATLSRMSPAISKVGSIVGRGVGMAMAAPLMGVNPGLASAVGNMGKNVAEGAIGIAGRGTALGAMAAGNILQAGSVSEGIKQTATIKTPIDPEQYQGYTGMTHETKVPESTAHAALGLIGASLNSNTAQGYVQGQNFYRATSTVLDTATKIGNKVAEPMQWRT